MSSSSNSSDTVSLDFANNASWRTFDGIGGVSGGGATSTFLEAYAEPQRSHILDWLFTPGYGASLSILKVEVGSDDQTTDGCEGCHMRSEDEVSCSRGYEWQLMTQAVARNPDITLYGLPWGWAGWLGFGTTNPFTNASATADYLARWVECGRDAHGLNISVIGIWNEASSFWAPPRLDDTLAVVLALRRRLDSGGLAHVRIIVPDGNLPAVAEMLHDNATVRAAAWGLGAHYPGWRGTRSTTRALGMPLWSSEDYSTYSVPLREFNAHRRTRVDPWRPPERLPPPHAHTPRRLCLRTRRAPAAGAVCWFKTSAGATARPSRGTCSAASRAGWTTTRTGWSAPSGRAAATTS